MVERYNLLLLFSVARLGLDFSLGVCDLRLEVTTPSNILGDSSDAVSLRDGIDGSGFSAETGLKRSPNSLFSLGSTFFLSTYAGGKAGKGGAPTGRAGKGLSFFFQK
jgi:hypothetical protein